MNREKEMSNIDFDEVVVYPGDYNIKIRKKLLNALRKLGVSFEY